MADKFLVRGRWLVTDAKSDVLDDHGVLVEGQLVSEIGPWDELQSANPDMAVIGDQDSAVIPGLINAHHHSHAIPSLLLGIPDRLLESWILSWHAMRGVDRHLDTLIASGMQLGSGVTSVVDMLSAGGSSSEFTNTLEDACSAYNRSGIKVALAAGSSSRSHIVSGEGEDQRFLDWLPDDVRPMAETLLPGSSRLPEDDYFDVMADFQRQYQCHDRIDIWYGPPGPQWVSEPCMIRCIEEAERWDCGIQTHVNESFYEKLHGHRFYGKSTMGHLQDIGVLGPRFSIAHGTWLDDGEIEIMAETGAAISHNPSSNLRLRAGIAPLREFLSRNVTTGIGMDSTTINDNEDMFAELRLATRLQCDPHIENTALSIRDVVGAAQIGGAKLMGKGETIGKIAPGKAADLVVLDTRKMTWPWMAPEADPFEIIYLRAQRQDVKRVIIDGETVWKDGQPVRFDLPSAARELAHKMAGQAFPEERQRAVDTVMPYIEKWYAQWDKPRLDPWIPNNSQR